jgi:hypothetical protein
LAAWRPGGTVIGPKLWDAPGDASDDVQELGPDSYFARSQNHEIKIFVSRVSY